MPDILIKGDAAKNQVDEEKQLQTNLDEIAERITDVKRNLRFKIKASEQIGSQLEQLINTVERYSKDMGLLSTALSHSIEDYNKTENRIILHTSLRNSTGVGDTNSSANKGMGNSLNPNADNRGFFEQLMQDGKVERSAFSMSNQYTGSIFGISTGIGATRNFLSYGAKIGKEASYNITKGEVGASAKAALEGYLYKGEIKGNVGLLSDKFTNTVESVSIGAEASANLMKDNKFQPTLGIKAFTEGKGITVGDEVQLGWDKYNTHTSAEGTLGYGKAEAGIGIGDLGLDKAGNHQYGVEAKAGAEASLLKGEIKSGVTICGIKIDAGVEGKVISVGAEAGASIKNKSFSANAGVSDVLGAEVKLNVDWSEFEMPSFDWLTNW